MPDWSEPLQETFEFYVVDTGTWKDERKLDNVKSCSITRDSTVETLGSATIDVTETVGESYIRVYLVTIQNGVKERHPLGTFLVQTPSSKFDGKKRDVTMDAYTPLLELKENPPPIGYSLLKGENIMETASMLCREHMRAPVVATWSNSVLYNDFVANTSDTWLTFLSDLIANAKHTFDIDELGRILFAPKQDTASLQPVWTYTDDNSSILYADVTADHDLYGIPNVVEVVYSSGYEYYYARVVNDDENSPTSTVNRGREIIHRINNPEQLIAPAVNPNLLLEEKASYVDPIQRQLDEYAEQMLRALSCLERTITYSHGYCPVRVGDCIRFNYKRADLSNIKARVISQTIKCEAGCKVTEKAVFTTNLWR